MSGRFKLAASCKLKGKLKQLSLTQTSACLSTVVGLSKNDGKCAKTNAMVRPTGTTPNRLGYRSASPIKGESLWLIDHNDYTFFESLWFAASPALHSA